MVLSKKKLAEMTELVGRIIDSQDSAVVVVRQKDCKLHYLNSAARERLPEKRRDEASCRTGFSELFPDLCDHCPARAEGLSYPHTFDTTDKAGRIFEVTVNTLDWLDDRPACIFFLRDMHEVRTATTKLYDLAYIDSLTGIPNRRKFKEDFEALEHEIAMGRQSGIVSIIDLDNFKIVNDTYGHSTGDFMLRALIDHLQGDPAFAGHLYRLGGDEFALLYNERTPRPDAQAYYQNLLEGALLAYSMPNIDISCTISMGIAFFPRHGDNYSELLRKADIALYEAKNGGRNRIAFFEEMLDKAQKFKDVYIGIQPILDDRGQTYGYELIDNGTGSKDETPAEEVVYLTEFNRTVDMLGLEDLSSDARFFITYTQQMLTSPPAAHLKRKFIVEIHMPPTVTPAVLEDYRRLRSLGFKVAVSGLNAANMSAELLAVGDYIKFAPGAFPEDIQARLIAGSKGKQFIATGIDTHERFTQARNMGYTLFQGLYFSEARPSTAKTKEIEPIKYNYFRLLQLTATEEYVDFGEISEVISSDLALSYKLLKLLNSAALALPNRISSISTAVAYLGEEHLKRWIALLGLRGVAPDKPIELVRMSLVRARFGELLSPHFRPRRNARHVFLTGLLSLLHVALDKSMEEVIEEMPVHEDIAQSLLTKLGPHSDLVAFFKNYEYSNWDEVIRYAADNNLPSQLINDSYLTAVKWTSDLIDA